MNKREEDEQQIDTVPPPPGEEDAYSAETRIGKIPSDLLQAMKRAHASEATLARLPEESGKAVAAAVSAALKTPASHLAPMQERPTVPRVTPTIPPPAERLSPAPPLPPAAPIAPTFPTSPTSHVSSPAGVPLNERASDFPTEDGVERDSEDADYVRTMLMFQGSPLPGAAPAGVPPIQAAAPFYLPKVDVNLTPELSAIAAGSSSLGSSAPPSHPSHPSPLGSSAPVTALSPFATGASGVSGGSVASVPPGTSTNDSAGASSSSRPSASGSMGHPIPSSDVLQMMDEAKVDEGRMSFAPFMTQESRRLNILLGVGIGFFLILMIIVLASAK